tara:strand:+ start:573 stop:1370 length:798 start_codon:yes stop_codon:yes gene_type:complete
MTFKKALPKIFFIAVVMLLCSPLPALPSKAENLTILAASSTINALEEVIGQFNEYNEHEVTVSYASSAALARQIEYGVPADIFISANSLWMDYLSKNGLVDSKSRRNLAKNSLVIIAPADSTIHTLLRRSQLSFSALIQDLGSEGRLAIGDPDSVPAGIYAREALLGLKLWTIVKDRLATASNVRSALMLVSRGETPLGVVYKSDALHTDEVAIVKTLPTTSHSAIIYPIAIVTGRTKPSTYHLLNYLTSRNTAKVFRRHGFTTP